MSGERFALCRRSIEEPSACSYLVVLDRSTEKTVVFSEAASVGELDAIVCALKGGRIRFGAIRDSRSRKWFVYGCLPSGEVVVRSLWFDNEAAALRTVDALRDESPWLSLAS